MVLSSHHKKLAGYYSDKNDISTERILYGYFQGMRPHDEGNFTKHQTMRGGRCTYFGKYRAQQLCKHILTYYLSVNIL